MTITTEGKNEDEMGDQEQVYPTHNLLLLALSGKELSVQAFPRRCADDGAKC